MSSIFQDSLNFKYSVPFCPKEYWHLSDRMFQFLIQKIWSLYPYTTTNARWFKELIFLMVYLSQLLRKDNFLTIEAIEEIISDKFDGSNYIFKNSPFFLFLYKENQQN